MSAAPPLVGGPYVRPPLSRGDRGHCLYRDRLCVATSWTDAPIPWPRCHAVDGGGGSTGPLVNEELLRAIRAESAAGLRHWSGSRRKRRW